VNPNDRAKPEDPSASRVRDAWETNAEFWDDYYREGNAFHRTLIAPATEKLLKLQQGETVLDVACGNGAFTRRMAALGGNVVAVDFSETFIERARTRTTEDTDRIEYRVLDATDPEALCSLGEGRFDAVVCTMALMDMEAIDPLAEALPHLLKPNGRFVFSIQHPCFNQTRCRLTIEEEDRGGELVLTRSVKISRYMTPFPSEGIGIRGQPVPHHYFHRPLQELLRPFFDQGLVLDGLEERSFEIDETRPPRLSWDAFSEIPPVLVVRLVRR